MLRHPLQPLYQGARRRDLPGFPDRGPRAGAGFGGSLRRPGRRNSHLSLGAENCRIRGLGVRGATHLEPARGLEKVLPTGPEAEDTGRTGNVPGLEPPPYSALPCWIKGGRGGGVEFAARGAYRKLCCSEACALDRDARGSLHSVGLLLSLGNGSRHPQLQPRGSHRAGPGARAALASPLHEAGVSRNPEQRSPRREKPGPRGTPLPAPRSAVQGSINCLLQESPP